MRLTNESCPRFKPSTHVFRRGDDDFLLTDWSRQIRWTVRMSERGLQLLQLADGSKTVAELAAQSGVSPASALRFLAHVDDLDLLVVPTRAPADDRSGVLAALEPLSTQARGSGEMLERLSHATVAVVGIGGVGTWACQHLAMHGVGKLVLLDPDIVALDNLHRQTLFSRADVGTLKVDAAARALWALSPNTQVAALPLRVAGGMDDEWLDGVDLAVAAADEPSTSEVSAIVSSLCFPLDIPHIGGFGYTPITTSLPQTVVPADPDCACLFCEKPILPPAAGKFEYVAPGGRPLGPIAAILGSLVALEAIRMITGFQEPAFRNVRGDYDFRTLRVWRAEVAKDPNCWFCSIGGVSWPPSPEHATTTDRTP